MNIIQAMDDERLFAPFFRGDTWGSWRTVLKALFALPMDRREAKFFKEISGGRRAPKEAVKELWAVVGRRGGKSRIMALLAVYLACFRDYSPYLSPGERALVPVIAQDRRQARVILGYVRAMLSEIKLLRAMLELEKQETFDLKNNVTIEIHTASFRAVRGYTIAAAICDEVAYWRDETSANPDTEIIAALRPAMATIPDALLVAASSPYRRAGALYEAYEQNFGQDGELLVVQAASRKMNPALPERFVKQQYARDPVSAAAEYGAEFRGDVSAFLDDDWITAAVRDGAEALPRVEGVTYSAFVDPSGGRKDSFTLGIAHRHKGARILDLIVERKPPFSPAIVAAEFAAIARSYGCGSVTGDRYAGQFVPDAFRAAGIDYEPSALVKSEIYLACGPLFASNVVEVPNNKKLIAQLRGLERRTARGGRDSIDHPPNGSDDLANAACGALWLASASDVSLRLESVGLSDAPVVRGHWQPFMI